MGITPIELLEYSKDNIYKVKHTTDLPDKYDNKLSLACKWLSEVQKYLFKH